MAHRVRVILPLQDGIPLSRALNNLNHLYGRINDDQSPIEKDYHGTEKESITIGNHESSFH